MDVFEQSYYLLNPYFRFKDDFFLYRYAVKTLLRFLSINQFLHQH